MRIDRGIVAALIAAVLFGISTPIAKLFVGSIPPLLLSGLLYVGSGLGLGVVLIIRTCIRANARYSLPRGGELWWLFGAVAAGGVVGPFLLMFGLQTTDSASASLILNLEGVLTALLAWFVFKENFDRRIALGMALIISGGVVLSVGPDFRAEGLIGPLAITAACLAWAVDNNLTRKISAHDAISIACIKGLTAGSISLGLATTYGARMPSGELLVAAGVLGFAGYGISLSLFVLALRRLGTARTGAYFSLAPFVGAVVAVALGAPLTLTLILAGLLMGAGVWLHLTEHHLHWHRHDVFEHAHSHTHDEHHQHAHGSDWNGEDPHIHVHTHEHLEHAHAHYPDIHHRHNH